MIAPAARPNRCHIKLSELECDGRLAAVVTQNIDGLHQAAGSERVWELHGSVHRNICQRCGATYSAEWVLEDGRDDPRHVPVCPACGGTIKPDVVLYGETLRERVLEGAVRAIAEADLLVIGGTSLVVYPAAGLTRYFSGDTLAIVNRDPTPQDAQADVLISCDIAKAFDFRMVQLGTCSFCTIGHPRYKVLSLCTVCTGRAKRRDRWLPDGCLSKGGSGG